MIGCKGGMNRQKRGTNSNSNLPCWWLKSPGNQHLYVFFHLDHHPFLEWEITHSCCKTPAKVRETNHRERTMQWLKKHKEMTWLLAMPPNSICKPPSPLISLACELSSISTKSARQEIFCNFGHLPKKEDPKVKVFLRKWTKYHNLNERWDAQVELVGGLNPSEKY